MAMLESVTWLVSEGLYPSRAAVFMGLRRGELPAEAIVRRGRRLLIRPDVVGEWVKAGCPKPKVPDLRRRGAR